MDKMDREGKFWFCLWSVVLSAVIICVITFCITNYKIQKEYIENGYEQIHISDVSGHTWKKIECK